MDKMDKTVSPQYAQGTQGEGNEKSPPLLSKPGKRQILGKYWCSGIFNHTVEDLKNTFENHKHFCKCIIGEEICPKTGNKHLQTFISFNKPVRPIEAFKNIQTKWIKCNGSEEQNEKYCSKDGVIHKFGEAFESDWRIQKSDLRENQLSLVIEIEKPVCKKFNRSCLWYWENDGDWGKSIIQTYFVDNHKCLLCGGKEADMKFAVASYIEKNGFPSYILINLEKSKDMISYVGLEALLDGMFFSSKYESGMVRFPRCRVVVFANIPPDESKMGKNRFITKKLSSQKNVPKVKKVVSPLDFGILDKEFDSYKIDFD